MRVICGVFEGRLQSITEVLRSICGSCVKCLEGVCWAFMVDMSDRLTRPIDMGDFPGSAQ